MRAPRLRRLPIPLLLLSTLLAMPAGAASAQTTFPGAEHIEQALRARYDQYEGQTVEPPAPRPRPAGAALAGRSVLRPLSVHATAGVPADRVRRALEALEQADALLEEAGWPAPFPDGGRGGTGGFDLYLASGGEHEADAYADAPIPWMHLDAVSSFAVVDPTLGGDALEACVTSAYAQAVLLGQDPAEALQWRRATGAWLAWMVTGRFGCDDAVAVQQREPWRSWIAGAAGDGAGGALLLAMISDRHDRGSGAFIEVVWQLARQYSDEGPNVLRGSPDLWKAFEAAIEASGSKLKDDMVDFAVARWLTGTRDDGRAPLPSLRGLPSDATPPLQWQTSWEQLPEHTDDAAPALEPFGSAYGLVDVSAAAPGSLLRTWLRGEYRVQWSLVAQRLGPDGELLARMTAPPREVPHSYLPVELFEGTERVLVVTTNLSSRLPDADIPDENVRSVKLIFDDGEDEEQERQP